MVFSLWFFSGSDDESEVERYRSLPPTRSHSRKASHSSINSLLGSQVDSSMVFYQQPPIPSTLADQFYFNFIVLEQWT